MNDESDAEAAVWRVIEGEHVANWMRDFKTYASHHANAPYTRFWGWVRSGGIVRRNGWAELKARMQQDMEIDVEPNRVFAYGTRCENKNVHVAGTLAWVTYDHIYPTADLDGFSGPGIVHEVRILEMIDGAWRIVFKGILDDQFGQTTTPLWEIDRIGKVVRKNPAAARLENADCELVIRNGRVRMREAEIDRELQSAIGWVAQQDFGAVSRHCAAAVVFEPGGDSPARIWWVATEAGRLTLSCGDAALTSGRIEVAASVYSLSPSQHRLALSILQGRTLAEAAKAEGIRHTTARTQLQRIFDKVGVRTQPALVRALMAVEQPEP